MTTPTSQLPPLPQTLPKTQGDWQQVLTAFQVWAQLLGQGTPWVAPKLLNGWTNYSTAYNPSGFCIRLPDRVSLRGLISAGTTSDNTVLFTLPVAPAYRVVSIAQAFTGAAYAPVRVDVDTSGNVMIFNAAGIQWLCLDQVSFSLLP